ncbi:MAG: tetratricopeptide repeat protein [Fibrobacter sp.]|nr:tetratricopeptide repeat protein [Fibrobacter sp.]
MAGFHYQEKDWPKALVAYQDALKKHPDAKDSPWGMYQLANVLRRQAKYEDAVEAYEAVIKEHPQSYWAEQAKWNKEDAIWRANNENLLRLK